MADNIGNKAAHDYHLDIPQVQEGFFVKGASHCDWGMKNRMARLFDPKSGNTVMLAFDHGYIMGATAGLERIDLLYHQYRYYHCIFRHRWFDGN